jgi:hypothetical protein
VPSAAGVGGRFSRRGLTKVPVGLREVVEGALGSAESLVTSAGRAPPQFEDRLAPRARFFFGGSTAALPLPLPLPFSRQEPTAWLDLPQLLHTCWYPLGQGMVQPAPLKSLQGPDF